jgi:hypothetical protein
MQLNWLELPSSELEFVGQSMQLAEPVIAVYLPASHAVHGPPSGPVDPALQMQLVTTALPSGELEYTGQLMHVEIAEAPTAVDHFPASQ